MALDDDFSGGYSQYYNPSFGLMAIQQPDMFVQHLARNGVAPPADFPDDFSHIDAHGILSQGAKDQSRAPGMGESSGPMPQQGSFDERFSDAMRGPPGVGLPFTAPSGPRAGSSDTLNPKFPAPNPTDDVPPVDSGGKPSTLPPPFGPWPSANEAGPPKPRTPIPGPTEAAPEGPAERLGRAIGADRIGKWLRGDLPPSPKSPGPKAVYDAPTTPLSPDRPLPRPRPTAAADTPPTTGAGIAEGDTSEPPGGLNEKDPSAKTESAKEKKENKGNAWDSFGKALAGVSAMKTPTPVFPHPGNIPHPGTQLSRSPVPSELLKELSQIGHPGQLIRLGAALKGR